MGEKHKISFEPVDIEMEVDEGETILDAAFRQNIHLMHGCREGQCSACKSYVLDGDIQMDRYSTFACNDAEVDEGYVLLCRSHAYSDCQIELLNFDEDELLNSIPIQEVSAEVVSIESMTRDIVSLRLRPAGAEPFQYKPGQYAGLTIPGTEEHRSFSMATTPSQVDYVEFLIKKYPGGRFSGLLEDGISVGDTLRMVGPYGGCTLKDGHVLPIVAIAGGAGMAPVLSLLRQLAEIESTRPVHFYYGARTVEDLFLLDEIAETGKSLRDFSFVACLSESMPPDWAAPAGVEGAVGNVTDVVQQRESDLRSTEVYFCGPPPMVDAALAMISQHGTPSDQVFYDKFTSPLHT